MSDEPDRRMDDAAATADTHLRGCLPPGVPVSYRQIVRAKRIGSGRRQIIRAELVMFDGEPATVEVFKAGEVLGVAMWGHYWTAMPGGPCSFEEGRWQRFPEQLDMLAPSPQTTEEARDAAG